MTEKLTEALLHVNVAVECLIAAGGDPVAILALSHISRGAGYLESAIAAGEPICTHTHVVDTAKRLGLPVLLTKAGDGSARYDFGSGPFTLPGAANFLRGVESGEFTKPTLIGPPTSVLSRCPSCGSDRVHMLVCGAALACHSCRHEWRFSGIDGVEKNDGKS